MGNNMFFLKQMICIEWLQIKKVPDGTIYCCQGVDLTVPSGELARECLYFV